MNHFRDNQKKLIPTLHLAMQHVYWVAQKILCLKFLQSAILNHGILAARAYPPDPKQ